MAERKGGKKRTSDPEGLFTDPKEKAMVEGLVGRLSEIDGVQGLSFGQNRTGGNRTFYVVARGGRNGEDPLEPAKDIEQRAMDQFYEAFPDKRSRWNVEVVTEVGLQRSRRDFDRGRGQILTTVWRKR